MLPKNRPLTHKQIRTLDNRAFKSHLIKIISIPVIFIILLMAYTHFQLSYRESLLSDIEVYDAVTLNSVSMERALSEMGASFRAYLVTGNDNFYSSYEKAKSDIDIYEEAIFKAIGNNYNLSRAFRRMTKYKSDWIHNADSIMESKKAGLKFDDIQSLGQVTELEASGLEDLRLSLNTFKELVAQHRQEKRLVLEQTRRWAQILEVLFALMFVLFLAYLITRQLKELTSSYRDLLERNLSNIKKIETASKSKDLFLANMSHEIRTPLGAIMGFAELVYEDEKLEPQTKSHIAFIKRNSEHLLSLIDDLFDLSKLTAQKIDIFIEKIDIKQMINDICNIFSSKMSDKNIALDIKLQSDIPAVFESDPVRIKQIFSNLIGNAIKFSPNNSKIDMILSYNDSKIIVDVIDQGVGISPAAKKVIFEAFKQVDAKHSRQYGGAGLGLSISKKMAEILGGNVELINSRLNVGSHFRATIPVNVPSEEMMSKGSLKLDELQIDDNLELSPKKEKFDFSNSKILLAEDSRENQILFKIFIESANADLTIVDNGTDAVRKALNEDYDLILMDIQMPGLDGYEALKILRGSNFDKKVVALTAHTMKGEKEKCLASGFDDYLSKPVSQQRLLKTIRKTLNH